MLGIISMCTLVALHYVQPPQHEWRKNRSSRLIDGLTMYCPTPTPFHPRHPPYNIAKFCDKTEVAGPRAFVAVLSHKIDRTISVGSPRLKIRKDTPPPTRWPDAWRRRPRNILFMSSCIIHRSYCSPVRLFPPHFYIDVLQWTNATSYFKCDKGIRSGKQNGRLRCRVTIMFYIRCREDVETV